MPFLEEAWQCFGLPWKRQSNLLVSVCLVFYLRGSECSVTCSALLAILTMQCVCWIICQITALSFVFLELFFRHDLIIVLNYFVVLPLKTVLECIFVA